jgi:membrane protease YdiL (CAAX protease family)
VVTDRTDSPVAPPDPAASVAAVAVPPLAGEAAPPAVRPIERVVSFIEIVFCSGLLTQVAIALLLHALGWSPLRADGTFSLRYVATLSLLDTALVTALAIYFLWSRGEPARAVFLGRRRGVSEILLGLWLVVPILLTIAGLGWALRALAPWLHNVEDNPLAALMRDPASIAVFAGVVVIAGGVREEIQRAFVLHRFRQHLGGAVVGLLVFSIAFGLGHLMQGYDAAILTGVLGLIWGGTYLRRGSLVAPAVSHSLFNLFEVTRHALWP